MIATAATVHQSSRRWCVHCFLYLCPRTDQRMHQDRSTQMSETRSKLETKIQINEHEIKPPKKKTSRRLPCATTEDCSKWGPTARKYGRTSDFAASTLRSTTCPSSASRPRSQQPPTTSRQTSGKKVDISSKNVRCNAREFMVV